MLCCTKDTLLTHVCFIHAFVFFYVISDFTVWNHLWSASKMFINPLKDTRKHQVDEALYSEKMPPETIFGFIIQNGGTNCNV